MYQAFISLGLTAQFATNCKSLIQSLKTLPSDQITTILILRSKIDSQATL